MKNTWSDTVTLRDRRRNKSYQFFFSVFFFVVVVDNDVKNMDDFIICTAVLK